MSKKKRLSHDQKRQQKLAKQRKLAERVGPYEGRKYQGERFAQALFLAEKAILECDVITEHELTDAEVERSLEYLVLELRGQKPARLPTDFNVERPDGLRDDMISRKILEFWAMNHVRHAPADLSGILRTIWNSVRTRHSMGAGPRGYLTFLDGFMTQAGQGYERLEPDEEFDEWSDSADEDDDIVSPAGALPDRRLLEHQLWQTVDNFASAQRSPQQQRAHDVLAQAYESDSSAERIKFAKRALEIWPDCADAYVVLAEHADNRQAALKLYEAGLAAGRRALGEAEFNNAAGHFWSVLPTRPYMRAKHGVSQILWALGRWDESVKHLQEMLELNPDDNQGVRYELAAHLLQLDRDDDLLRLLDRYDEGAALWAYTRALSSFRRQGDSPDSQRLLEAALAANAYVPEYLTGQRRPPAESPAGYSPGKKSEAQVYAQMFLPAWTATAGAVTWLRGQTATEPAPSGPVPVTKARLANLRQSSAIWLADCRLAPFRVNEGGARRPWLCLLGDADSGMILAQEMTLEQPTGAFLRDWLADTMAELGGGQRPREIRMPVHAPWDALAKSLEEIGVRCTQVTNPGLDDAFASLAEHMGQEDSAEEGLLQVPGVTSEQIGRIYEAAAAFYRQAPWKRLGFEAAIESTCPDFEGGPWYAIVMGQSGMAYGLAIYDDLEALRKMWAGNFSDEKNAELGEATTIQFVEPDFVPFADLEAARQHGWEIARPDAHPWIFHKERGMKVRSVELHELDLLEACLHAIPSFMAHHVQDDPSKETLHVHAGHRQVYLTLSWVQAP